MFSIAFCANRPVLLRRPGVGEPVRTALRGRTNAEDGYPAFETYLMPRADPTRSSYCATRHLLRNLDDPAELRRNPLVTEFFPPMRARRAAPHAAALQHIRGLVLAALVACRDTSTAGRSCYDRARVHAALLRCDLDKQPVSVVAAELGLSGRQLRRERRAAHIAFAAVFGRQALSVPIAVRDIDVLRLSEAVELHELGRSVLAATVCDSIAAGSQRSDRRLEALCLAAEVDLDAGRYDEASAKLAHLNRMLCELHFEMDEAAYAVAAESVDFVAWSLRRVTGAGGGLGTPAPLAVARADSAGKGGEPQRALLVRAYAAYASQRCDVGDKVRCREALQRAQELLPFLDPSRAKERFALMYADAKFYGLHDSGAARDRFLAIEQLALRRSYVRTMLGARAERIGNDFTVLNGGDRVFEHIVGPVDLCDRRMMPSVLADAARIAAQCERNPERVLAAANFAERLVPPRSATALFARCSRIKVAMVRRELNDAYALAHDVRADASALGNGRLRGTAAHYLAAIAHVQRRRRDALRYVTEAMMLLEQYGSQVSFAQAKNLSEKLDAAKRSQHP